MQNSHNHEPTSYAPLSPRGSAVACEPGCFMTPPKKTKACNLSPGKKPSLRSRAGAGAVDIATTPFNLLLSLES